jgi:hypothetical protein
MSLKDDDRVRLPASKTKLVRLCVDNPAFRRALYQGRITPKEGLRIYRLAATRTETEERIALWRDRQYLREFARCINELRGAMKRHEGSV